MNVLNNTINRIEQLIREVPERVSEIIRSEFDFKPSPEKWSKKEIIGHLCDSALNNLIRFIKAQLESNTFVLTKYDQDDWVRVNNYHKMKSEDVLTYWVSLNSQIVHVIKNIPEEKLAVVCELGDASFRESDETKNLLWLIEDYVVHMEYHLTQIFNEK